MSSFPAFTAGADSYIVQLPIPGYSYFWGSVAAGAVTLTGVQADDFLSFFPTNYEANNASSYRFAGQSMEIVPTVNAMTWAGSVQVARGPVTLSYQALSATTGEYTIGGLSSLIFTSKPEAVHPFNMGCYCTSRPSEKDFPFRPVLTGTTLAEVQVAPYYKSGALTVAINGAVTPFTGLGTMEAIVYKIPAYSSTANIGTIRTWANVEFTVSSASIYYEFCRMSPPHDPVAIALARKAYEELMLCVPFYENDGTWMKIWGWIKDVLGVAAMIPGPVGEISTGLSVAAMGIDALLL